MEKDEIIYIRPSGVFKEGRPVGLELCVGDNVYPLKDKTAIALARDIIMRLL